MEKLIPIINQLQEVCSTSGYVAGIMQLPQIVVVGEQSAGKSSVLESFVGRTCLPRGKGIVTRCPVILQLIQIKGGGEDENLAGLHDYCEFPHLPEDKNPITDFDQIIDIINEEVDNRAGKNKGIINEELIMKIYSPNVVNLTVVDLPGMVKNPTGDQPIDIEQQVADMIRRYIQNPNSIILAVSTATNDIACSASLKLAKEVDPELDRTVAVITKLDLMDHGTNAMELLTGAIIQVKLGIFGVVNRSFEDIQKNRTVADSIAREARFLKKKYPLIAEVNGSPYLKLKLQALLLGHIQKCLPQLQKKMQTLKGKVTDELETIGRSAPQDKSKVLRHIIEKFCIDFKGEITGRKYKDIDRKVLALNVRVKQIFENVLIQKLNSVDPLVDLKDDKLILNTISNCKLLESAVVVPEVAFQDLTREQIRKLDKPLLECASSVHTLIEKIVNGCIIHLKEEIERFPKIKSCIVDVVLEMLLTRYQKTEKELKKYIQFQASYITLNQSLFCNEANEFLQLEFPQARHAFIDRQNNKIVSSANRFTDAPSDQCKVMRDLVSKYFNIVKSDALSYWPKVLYKTVIEFMEEHVHDQLLAKLYTAEKTDEIINENCKVVERRGQLLQQFEELEKASKIVNVIRDTQI